MVFSLFGVKAGNIRMVDPRTILSWRDAGQLVLIDVREREEYAAERIDGAINLPLSTFDPARLPEIPDGKKLVLHCRSGQRCGMAAARLVEAGYKGEINRMDGGIMGWRMSGCPVL